MINLKQKRRDLIDKVETGQDVLDKYGIKYDIFTNIPEELKLSEEDKGKQVWVAGESRTTSAYLREVKEEGEDEYPEGGFEVIVRGDKYIRSYFKNQVILHPDEIKKSEEQIEYEKAVEEAKKQKYENPLTGRDCSYKYSVRQGFITETGEKIPLEEMKFENPETGRMVSYNYAKQKGII